MTQAWSDTRYLVSQLSPTRNKTQNAATLLRTHLTAHPGYVAWSGGKDSTAVVHLAHSIEPGIPVVWFDSGIEYPETRTYIHYWAREWGLNLHTFHPRTSTLAALKTSPSFTHNPTQEENDAPTSLHELLISEPSRRAHQQFGAGETTGVRAEESAGRRALLAPTNGTYQRSDGAHVCCPIWNWTTRHVSAYLHEHNIPENPTYQRLRDLGAPEWAQRVGILVDGNAVTHGRFTWLRLGWPEMWSELVEELPRLTEWR